MFLLQIVRKKAPPESTEDRDAKEALKEFDFLVTSEEGDAESRSAGDGTDWGEGGEGGKEGGGGMCWGGRGQGRTQEKDGEEGWRRSKG